MDVHLQSSPLAQIDKAWEYPPGFSTIANLVNLFQKCVIVPILQAMGKLGDSHYYSYLKEKSFLRCVTLLIPVIGNVIVGLYDLAQKKYDDRYYMESLIGKNIESLKKAGPRLRKDTDFIRSVIGFNAEAIQYVDESLSNDREFLLDLVKRNPEVLRYMNAQHTQNLKFMRKAVKRTQQALEYASDNVLNDKKFMLNAINQWGIGLQYAKDLKEDREVVLAAVSKDGEELAHAGESLKDDKEVVLAAIRESVSALGYASETLRNDPQFILEAMQIDKSAFVYANLELHSNKDFMLEAIKFNAPFFLEADKKMKEDRDFVIQAVVRNGKVLTQLNEPFNSDKEIVLIALGSNSDNICYAESALEQDRDVRKVMKNPGLFLRYISLQYRDQKEFVMLAVRNEWEMLELASDRLKNDPEVVTEAVRSDGRALQFASAALQKDPKIVKIGVSNTIDTLRFAHKDLRDDPEVMSEAVERNMMYFKFAGEKLKRNKQFVFKCLERGVLNICWIPRELLLNRDFLKEALLIRKEFDLPGEKEHYSLVADFFYEVIQIDKSCFASLEHTENKYTFGANLHNSEWESLLKEVINYFSKKVIDAHLDFTFFQSYLPMSGKSKFNCLSLNVLAPAKQFKQLIEWCKNLPQNGSNYWFWNQAYNGVRQSIETYVSSGRFNELFSLFAYCPKLAQTLMRLFGDKVSEGIQKTGIDPRKLKWYVQLTLSPLPSRNRLEDLATEFTQEECSWYLALRVETRYDRTLLNLCTGPFETVVNNLLRRIHDADSEDDKLISQDALRDILDQVPLASLAAYARGANQSHRILEALSVLNKEEMEIITPCFKHEVLLEDLESRSIKDLAYLFNFMSDNQFLSFAKGFSPKSKLQSLINELQSYARSIKELKSPDEADVLKSWTKKQANYSQEILSIKAVCKRIELRTKEVESLECKESIERFFEADFEVVRHFEKAFEGVQTAIAELKPIDSTDDLEDQITGEIMDLPMYQVGVPGYILDKTTWEQMLRSGDPRHPTTRELLYQAEFVTNRDLTADEMQYVKVYGRQTFVVDRELQKRIEEYKKKK